MLRCSSHIAIVSAGKGKSVTYEVDYVNQVDIESSWKNFTDTAKVTLPRKLKVGKVNLADIIKRGNRITVKLGYDEVLKKRFEGYVTMVGNGTPVVFECEDEMFALKQMAVKPKSWGKVSLENVLKYIGIKKFDLIGQADLGAFRIDRNLGSAAKVLEKIKADYGLVCFFRDGVLNIGKPYDPAKAKQHVFMFQGNIITSDLQYMRKEELRLKVKVINKMADNKEQHFDFGDKDGEERTLHFYNLPQKAIKARAEAEIERMRYDGYRGSFQTFGEPAVKHGDIAVVKDDLYPEREGKFFIDSVKTSFGMGGYRQEISLGPKYTA